MYVWFVSYFNNLNCSDFREHDKKSRLNEKLKKEFEDYEKEDVAIREAIKHAKEQIKKLTKTIDTEKEKVQLTESFLYYMFLRLN